MRLDYNKLAPDAFKVLLALEEYINKSGLDKMLIDLIRLRPHKLMAVLIVLICILVISKNKVNPSAGSMQ